jgi:hypothetical protein
LGMPAAVLVPREAQERNTYAILWPTNPSPLN